MENVGKDLRIHWHWNLQEGDEVYADETGYQGHRDFRKLQVAMLQWLQALCKVFAEEKVGQYKVSFPLGYPCMQGKFFAASPMGMWSNKWFDRVANTELHNLDWAGEEFFIWWNKPDDVHFYKHTGIALLNMDCRWHAPINEDERSTLLQIHHAFSTVAERNPSIELPQQDWAYVKAMLNHKDAAIPDTGYGYRKQTMTFSLGDEWTIDLPGTMCHSTDELTEIYYGAVYTVRCIAYHLPEERTEDDLRESFFDDTDNAGAERIRTDVNVPGSGLIFYEIDKESGSGYWVLQGVKVKDGKFAFSTICYPTEEHRQWAIDTWNSIRR